MVPAVVQGPSSASTPVGHSMQSQGQAQSQAQGGAQTAGASSSTASKHSSKTKSKSKSKSSPSGSLRRRKSATAPSEPQGSPPLSPSYHAVVDIGPFDEPNPSKRPTMEDVTVWIDRYLDDNNKGFFAVYDGHGGKDVSTFVGITLHKRLASILQEKADNSDKTISELSDFVVQRAIETAVEQTDEELFAKSFGKFQGCTACFAYVDRTPVPNAPMGRIWFVSVGDSRCILGAMESGEKTIQTTRMTRDHKPNDQDEYERVFAAGGFVTGGRVMGIIAVSRAMGDHAMKTFIISRPYINMHVIVPEDMFFAIACDGVWDVITDEDAGALVHDALLETGKAIDAARRLVEESVRRDTFDNVSALVVLLRDYTKLPTKEVEGIAAPLTEAKEEEKGDVDVADAAPDAQADPVVTPIDRKFAIDLEACYDDDDNGDQVGSENDKPILTPIEQTPSSQPSAEAIVQEDV